MRGYKVEGPHTRRALMGETDHTVTIKCDHCCGGKVGGAWESWVGHLNWTRWCKEGFLEELPCQVGSED